MHLNKNMKRYERSTTLVFENSLSVYMKEYTWYNMCVLKVVLIFRNILPSKLPFNLFFLILDCSVLYEQRIQYVLKIDLFFIITNLIQIKEKTHVPVTVHFPDYVFNESIHNMYCFHEWDVFLIHLFMIDQKLNNS